MTNSVQPHPVSLAENADQTGLRGAPAAVRARVTLKTILLAVIGLAVGGVVGFVVSLVAGFIEIRC